MFNRSDPRFRRRLNQISQNLESANESAQVGLFSFSEYYIKPCFGSIASCVGSCTAPCFPRDGRWGRANTRRPEANFDFYEDWEDDENDALLAWGNDEYERTEGTDKGQPGARNPMNYGSRSDGPRAGRKTTLLPYDDEIDPTTIPKSSVFGFMERLPFKMGAKALRYKPSAADLKDRSRGKKRVASRAGVIDEESHDEEAAQTFNGRQRSTTQTSGHTIESLSSRGDIFPSDDEDDAVPLDDEFELGLERRSTNEDTSSGKTRISKRFTSSRNTSRTHSSRSLQRQNSSRPDSSQRTSSTESEIMAASSLADLKDEEQRIQKEEEIEIEKKREAAQKLARERGLSVAEEEELVVPEVKEGEIELPRVDMTDLDAGEPIEPQGNAFPFPAPSADGEVSVEATKKDVPATPEEDEAKGVEHG